MTNREVAPRTESRSPMDVFLNGFFRRELDRANADFSREPFSYDGNSDYDHLCYGLVREAERLCRLRFGNPPSGCQLQRALALAEFERMRDRRTRRDQSLWRSLINALTGLFRRP